MSHQRFTAAIAVAVALTASGANPVSGSPQFGPLPSVTSDPAAPGGSIQATVTTAIGDAVLLIVGLIAVTLAVSVHILNLL